MYTFEELLSPKLIRHAERIWSNCPFLSADDIAELTAHHMKAGARRVPQRPCAGYGAGELDVARYDLAASYAATPAARDPRAPLEDRGSSPRTWTWPTAYVRLRGRRSGETKRGYAHGLPEREIAAILGLSRQRVSRIVHEDDESSPAP
jgi:hypothetical protein